MDLYTPLFEGEHICLAPMDHEKDPAIISRWTHDPGYLRMLDLQPARPLSPSQVKKEYEKIEKEAEEDKNLFHFTIRLREPAADGKPELCERLIGFVRLQWVEWTHGNAAVRIGIGEPEARGKGYGREALGLMLHYAFSELNLFRVTAVVPEYNQVALGLFYKAGFIEEVRRREAVERDGRRWDLLHLGLLRDEWLDQEH